MIYFQTFKKLNVNHSYMTITVFQNIFNNFVEPKLTKRKQ